MRISDWSSDVGSSDLPMTDIGSEAHVAPAQTQLPVHSYIDDTIFARERELIFKQSALYVGHEKLVPEVGDWRTLANENAGRVLVRNPSGVELLSNVCRHRQAIILGGETGHVTHPPTARSEERRVGTEWVRPC